MLLSIVEILIFALSTISIIILFMRLRKQPFEYISTTKKIQLSSMGVVGFFFDVIGAGSFPINIAISRALKLFPDKDLPALVNIAQVVPGAVASIIFLNTIHVDIQTLAVLCFGACVGGVFGAYFVSKLNQQTIRLVMVIAFAIVISLLLLSQFNLLKIAGDAQYLHGMKLWIGLFSLIICGVLTAAGVGMFALVQMALFLLGMSPLAVFPIMTTAGALQQPLSAIVFLKKPIICLRSVLLISFFGLFGVALGIPMVKLLSAIQLRWLLITVLSYNAISMCLSFMRERANSSQQVVDFSTPVLD